MSRMRSPGRARPTSSTNSCRLVRPPFPLMTREPTTSARAPGPDPIPVTGVAAREERVAPVHPDKLASALEHLRRWAADKGLEPSEVAYVAATRDRRALRFTADGDQVSERAWRTHWIAADLAAAARARYCSWRTTARCALAARTWTIWCSCPPATRR